MKKANRANHLTWLGLHKDSVFLCGLLILLLIVFAPMQVDAVKTTDYQDETFVTANYNGTSLSEVLQELNVQTGYDFVIPEDWSTLIVTGDFYKIPLEKFLHRILKNRSFALLIDEEEKIITGREFGNYSKYIDIADPYGIVKKIDPSSGLLVKDLRALHARQLKELQLRKANPDYIDPMSGIPLAELGRLHEKQLADAKQVVGAKDVMSGVPLDELERLHKKQLASVKNDEGVIDPMSGLPLDELERLHEKQLAGVKDNEGGIRPIPGGP